VTRNVLSKRQGSDNMQPIRLRHFQFLLLLLHQFWIVLMDSPMKAVSFNRIRPKTPVFCATPNVGMTQTSDKTIYGCSLDCSENDACVGFNHNEPQQVCQQFVSLFTNLSLTPGCTYYEVRRVAPLSVADL